MPPLAPLFELLRDLSLAALVAVPGPAAPAPTGALQDGDGTVLQTLEARGDAGTFLELLELVGVEEVVPEGTFTIFAPNDAAFGKLPEEQLRQLVDEANRDELLALLRHHVAPMRLDLATFGEDPRRASVQGQDLALRQTSGGAYLVDAGRLVVVDVACSDGLLHVVDELLVPAGLTVLSDTARFGTGRHTYVIDRVHSAVLFRVIHMEVGAQWGLFRSFAGEITYDHDEPQNSAIILAVDPTSIDTGNSDRDSYLQVADFFDSETHPGITYRSTKVTPAADGLLDVEGVLSFRGVDRDVPCRVEMIGQGRFGKTIYKVGFETAITIQRSDFGMTYGIPGVAGDEVRLTIALEADRELTADEAR